MAGLIERPKESSKAGTSEVGIRNLCSRGYLSEGSCVDVVRVRGHTQGFNDTKESATAGRTLLIRLGHGDSPSGQHGLLAVEPEGKMALMPEAADLGIDWEGHLDGTQVTRALLELAMLTFSLARQSREGKNSLTPRELAEVLQQTVVWANATFPGATFRLR